MRLLFALLALFALSAAPEPATRPAPAPGGLVPAVALLSIPEAKVPFGCGLAFPVSQAHDVGSHLQHDTWAWDFRMPEGTPVVAAYDGVVRLARGDSAAGGCDARFAASANYVVVDHGNGLETQYLHFSKVVVRPGDRVRAGDLLGLSGKTGWACGAHLHFKVARADGPGWNNPSVHAQIAGYGDPQVDAEVAAPACQAPKVQVAAKEPTPQDLAAPAQGASSAPAPAVAPASAPAPERPDAAPTRL
ncbi:MAG TPA: M23 family metallopeptidase [Myxococcales bacterium]|jgi:murein DD-endopeptidase MepM/ murein hydrolase activator NlpD|nr:M23 family metallopeptidase [Myxococcales bacterium]